MYSHVSYASFTENIFSALTLEAGDNWVNRHGLHVVFSVVVKILHMEAWNGTSKWKHNGSVCVCVCTFICAYVCLYLCLRVCASVPLCISTSMCLLV